MKENSHIPFSQITDSIIRDSIREANNYEHSKIVEPRHLLLAILRNDKNPVANWLSQLGLSYDRAIEMLYPTDKDDEQKTEESKDFKWNHKHQIQKPLMLTGRRKQRAWRWLVE